VNGARTWKILFYLQGRAVQSDCDLFFFIGQRISTTLWYKSLSNKDI
jgi:hypothetical protein